MLKFKRGEQLDTSDFGTYVKKPVPVRAKQIHEEFEVETLEGIMRGHPGDYLIVGTYGELYPCRREIFEKTYAPLKEVHADGS